MYNADQSVRYTVQPFGSSYKQGTRIAVGDVTGDGVPDVVAVTNGKTQARARIIDGATGSVLSTELFPGGAYTGAVSVAVGDVTGDGTDDIAIGTNQDGAALASIAVATSSSWRICTSAELLVLRGTRKLLSRT